jgi:hypothetical protein
MAHWNPPRALSEREEKIIGRLRRVRKLMGFLRLHRHEIFDAGFQEELMEMYRQTGAGKEPVPPAQLAMAVLVQAYLQASDASMAELTVLDRSVQLVLDCMDASSPVFSQSTLVEFRNRLIAADLDRRLLERSVEVARQRGGFDARKLPKSLRMAVDARPLQGVGRVEDTYNLLAHAARKVAGCAAELLGWSAERVHREADAALFSESSIKKGLDVDWSDPEDQAAGLALLVEQLSALTQWVENKLPEELSKPPLREHLATLAQIRAQDLEPDPDRGGIRIRQGVAEDRRVSVEDGQMRHGRKSRRRRFDGFRQHIATDLDTDLLYACSVTPANRPEAEGAPQLQADLQKQAVSIRVLSIDRGYIGSQLATAVIEQGGEVLCKPWRSKNRGLFPKSSFRLNLRDRTVTCPAGQSLWFELDSVIEFDAAQCDVCALRRQCTTAELGRGRTVTISADERVQQKLRKLQRTARGRARLRERTAVEHRLAHLSRRQGPRARYRGVRKNLFDLRRLAVVQNLETWHRAQTA